MRLDMSGTVQTGGCQHCTLALTKEDDEEVFYKASNLILHEFKKISGKFVSIGLVKISFPVEEIYTVDLDN